ADADERRDGGRGDRPAVEPDARGDRGAARADPGGADRRDLPGGLEPAGEAGGAGAGAEARRRRFAEGREVRGRVMGAVERRRVPDEPLIRADRARPPRPARVFGTPKG